MSNVVPEPIVWIGWCASWYHELTNCQCAQDLMSRDTSLFDIGHPNHTSIINKVHCSWQCHSSRDILYADITTSMKLKCTTLRLSCLALAVSGVSYYNIKPLYSSRNPSWKVLTYLLFITYLVSIGVSSESEKSINIPKSMILCSGLSPIFLYGLVYFIYPTCITLWVFTLILLLLSFIMPLVHIYWYSSLYKPHGFSPFFYWYFSAWHWCIRIFISYDFISASFITNKRVSMPCFPVTTLACLIVTLWCRIDIGYTLLCIITKSLYKWCILIGM